MTETIARKRSYVQQRDTVEVTDEECLELAQQYLLAPDYAKLEETFHTKSYGYVVRKVLLTRMLAGHRLITRLSAQLSKTLAHPARASKRSKAWKAMHEWVASLDDTKLHVQCETHNVNWHSFKDDKAGLLDALTDEIVPEE